MNPIERVVKWNSLRYEQQFNRTLAHNLLFEEVEEFENATTEVDQLDALIDTVYIAIGAMWKLGLSSDQISQAIHVVCDSNDTKPAKKTASNVKANIDKGVEFVPPEPRLQEILNSRDILP